MVVSDQEKEEYRGAGRREGKRTIPGGGRRK
jgi:hypothetical protein